MSDAPTDVKPTASTPESKEAFDSASPMMDKFNENMKVKINLTEEDKERFFKAFLADRPFSETVQLFGGKYTLTFQSSTIKQNNDIFRQVSLDQQKGIAKYEDTYFIKVTTYRFAVCLAEINGKAFSDITEENSPEKDGVTYVKLRADKLEEFPAYKLSIMIDAFRTFDQKVAELANLALSPDFWKANP